MDKRLSQSLLLVVAPFPVTLLLRLMEDFQQIFNLYNFHRSSTGLLWMKYLQLILYQYSQTFYKSPMDRDRLQVFYEQKTFHRCLAVIGASTGILVIKDRPWVSKDRRSSIYLLLMEMIITQDGIKNKLVKAKVINHLILYNSCGNVSTDLKPFSLE